MGRPVKIVDLATSMIRSAGYAPGKDIAIEFTGKRPGEKLREEVASFLENTVCTRHENIRILDAAAIDRQELNSRIETLRTVCMKRDMRGLVQALREIVPDYSPSDELLRRATQEDR
jgi:FlaA1/EpsC-like NDP-sugar epimerase